MKWLAYQTNQCVKHIDLFKRETPALHIDFGMTIFCYEQQKFSYNIISFQSNTTPLDVLLYLLITYIFPSIE